MRLKMHAAVTYTREFVETYRLLCRQIILKFVKSAIREQPVYLPYVVRRYCICNVYVFLKNIYTIMNIRYNFLSLYYTLGKVTLK